jgi:hypothetical protein
VTTPPAVAQTVAPQAEVAQAVMAQTAVAAQTAQAAPASPVSAPVGDVIATAPLPHTAQPTHLTPVDALPHRPAGANPGSEFRGP